MARKGWVVVVLAGLAFWLWHRFSPEPAINPSQMTQAIEATDGQHATSATDTEKKDSPKTQQKKTKPNRSIDPDHLLALQEESLTPVFSDDLYIEASVHQAVFLGCDMMAMGYYFKRIEMTQAGQELINKIKANCQKLKQDRPRMYLMSSQWDAMSAIPAESTWGKKLKYMQSLRGEDRKVYEQSFFEHALKTQQAHWLVLVMMNVHQTDHVFPHQKWLKTVNSRYIETVSQLALSLRICELSQSNFCAPEGVLMLEPCFNNGQLCGLDFPSWYEQAVMPGMKKDVDLVLDHYRAIAKGGTVE